MAYNIDNIIINLKREIRDQSGGGANPVNVSIIKSVLLRHQENLNETFTYEVTEAGIIVYSLQAMTGGALSFTFNDIDIYYSDGFRKVASGFLPVVAGDEVAFSCISEGSDENLILDVALITGVNISTPNNNRRENIK